MTFGLFETTKTINQALATNLIEFDAFPNPKLNPRWALVSKTTEL
jgi:hypothetical protein